MRPPVESIADQLFYTTVFIEAFTSVGRSTGTGFIINYPVHEGQFRPVLVTNKHVLEGAEEVAFTMPAADNAAQPASRGTRLSMTGFNTQSWVGHPDAGVDIGTMFFADVLTAMTNNGAAPFYRGFLPDQLATQDTANSLDAIEQVTVIGYPNGLFDQSSMLPIARRGQTATPIFNDYNNLPAFLIDASVFPGSSGSPVVLYDRGSYTTRDGSFHAGSRMALLGIVAAVHTRKVNGLVQMVSTGIATFDDMIDLGIVFKASAIQETVFALYEAAQIPLPLATVAPENLA
ncbi:trypsin-like peptidase domain-containing protein [Arthrobacter gandavensis]|uniref:trypsin-like peptidase domain-containing protein n=1 Tax=Arthrobacter gandavensis TaxID=169960 RepID=UPI00188FBA96|nr:trypsin-like peptidase domain-containing protein [Arthrobacter gandavensis]MBF4994410.1 trypsin-like peptidase domain-containing protein [Arthrobacter gandavensis]